MKKIAVFAVAGALAALLIAVGIESALKGMEKAAAPASVQPAASGAPEPAVLAPREAVPETVEETSSALQGVEVDSATGHWRYLR